MKPAVPESIALSVSQPPLSDLKAPSLEDFEALAADAFARLPASFRRFVRAW